jgi:hypothetical protein
MPMNRALYPANWREIALAVKEAAGWKCSECGAQCYRPGERVTDHRLVLTVHHLDADPSDCAPGNLRALCAVCHLQADAVRHGRHAAETRRQRLEVLHANK